MKLNIAIGVGIVGLVMVGGCLDQTDRKMGCYEDEVLMWTEAPTKAVCVPIDDLQETTEEEEEPG